MIENPTWSATSVHTINYDKILELGYEYLFIDLDNTLAPVDVSTPNYETMLTLKKIIDLGFKVTIVSNNSKARVSKFCKSLGINYIYSAMKPFIFKLKKYIKEHNIDENKLILIGDQFMTDIKCAMKLKCKSILLLPISEKDSIVSYFNRKRDNYYRNKYKDDLKSKNIDRR